MVVLDTDAKLDSMGFFQEDFNILDIGCGVGYIPKYLKEQKKNVTYLGLDVDMGVIQECKNRFPQFKFKRLNLKSESYNPLGSMSADQLVLPVETNSVDSIICHSIFTHLDTEAIAVRYMKEIKRVLKQGGFLWTTWFSSPPNEECEGTAKTVYNLAFIHDLLSDLEPIYINGGESTSYHDQLEIACVK